MNVRLNGTYNKFVTCDIPKEEKHTFVSKCINMAEKADVSNKDMYDSKILKAINRIKNISKEKPKVNNIHKYMI